VAIFQFLSHIAGLSEKIDEAIAEWIDLFIFFVLGEQVVFPDDIFGFCYDMGNAGLPPLPDMIVSGISISYQSAFKMFPKNVLCHLG
jgi:hypothetical protein